MAKPRPKQQSIPRSTWKKCECGRNIISTTGRTKCRVCHRKTVVWANPNNQRKNQSAYADFEPAPKINRFTEMSAKESESHLMSFIRMVGDIEFSPAVSLKKAGNFADLCAQYGGVPA